MSRDPSLSSVPLSTPDAPVLNQVGGKAASLIRLQQAGFDVPHGVATLREQPREWNLQARK